jgi:uncharacterized repeat protein (TIGR01451 family)
MTQKCCIELARRACSEAGAIDRESKRRPSAGQVCRASVLWLLGLSTLWFSGQVLAQTCTPPPSGLVAWWSGDGSAIDYAGSNAGSAVGGVSLVGGYNGGAFRFDGASGYVATPVDVQPGVLPSTTWEAWVYPTRLGGRQQILSHDDGGYDRSVMVEGNSFGVFTGGGVWAPAAITANQWQHIAVVFSPTNILFYRDGVRFSYGSAPSFGGSGFKLQIGRNPGYGEFFQGTVDEVSVYDRALTEAEIVGIYQAGTAGKCKPAVASADLAVVASASTDTLGLDVPVTVTINVVNSGPQPAANVVVTLQLPANLGFTSAINPTGSFARSGNLVTFAITNLGVGASGTLQVTANSLSTGLATNLVQAFSANPDPDLADNTASVILTIDNVRRDSFNGNWARFHESLLSTPEADLMLRTGDIDNLGFGWPAGFDPFSGNSTPSHGFPWLVDTNDPAGTDRILLGSSYDGHPPFGSDGYTGSTTRPQNLPQAITISNQLTSLKVHSAILQMFVDDFQSPVWGSRFQATINGVRAPFLEDILNQLTQTGPIGRLITLQVPVDYLSLVSTGNVVFHIDDPTTGAGDGYAVDFVKLLLNPHSLSQTGTITGTVRDTIQSAPIANALVSAGGGVATAYTDAAGNYALTNVAAGLVFVTASKPNFGSQTLSVNLIAGQAQTLNFQLPVIPRLRLDQVREGYAVLRWPAALSNWILERTPNLLSGPGSWSTVTTTPTIVGDDAQVLYPADGARGFFRLRKP